MAFLLGDIFIGDYRVTQDFGANEVRYNSLYNLKGHNGVDWGCPSLTPILSAAPGRIIEIGSAAYGTFDAAGYGNYIKVLHDGFFTLYAHLNDITVQLKDHVLAGELIGHSNNTGFSTGPHLHFGIAPCDANGVKTEKTNGYSGYIDPMDTARVQWDIKNLTEPIKKSDGVLPPVAVEQDDFVRIVKEGSNGKLILSYLVSRGMNGWLTNTGYAPVDMQNADAEDGKKATQYLQAFFAELEQLKADRPIVAPQEAFDDAVTALPVERQVGMLQAFLRAIKQQLWVEK